MSGKISAEKLKTLEERCMLQSLLGYANYLSEEIDQGKIKTVEEVRKKISDDADRASGALSYYFRDTLRSAGFMCGLLGETQEEEVKA